MTKAELREKIEAMRDDAKAASKSGAGSAHRVEALNDVLSLLSGEEFEEMRGRGEIEACIAECAAMSDAASRNCDHDNVVDSEAWVKALRWVLHPSPPEPQYEPCEPGTEPEAGLFIKWGDRDVSLGECGSLYMPPNKQLLGATEVKALGIPLFRLVTPKTLRTWTGSGVVDMTHGVAIVSVPDHANHQALYHQKVRVAITEVP